MVNVFTKPSGKLKGSQNVVIKGDKGGQGKSIPNPSKRAKVMAKVMKAYPNGPLPYAQKVVRANEAAKDVGQPISQRNSPRNLKYIGK